MDEYINKYLSILKKSQKLPISKLSPERPSAIASPEPSSILSKLTSTRKNFFTTTEEIYSEEYFQFCTKVQNRNSNSSPESSKSPIRSTNSPALSASPIKSRVFHQKSPTIQETIQKHSLPLLQKRKKNFKPSTEKKTAKKNHKINSILTACKDAEHTFTANSKRIKNLISKESLIAKEYTKEIEWTSRKLTELGGYNHNLMKKLYEEHKSSNSLFEKEKIMISEKYNAKTSDDFKQKVKGIKKLLNDYKLKIIP